MELLIEREPNCLRYTDGKVFVDSDVPEFLRRPMYAEGCMYTRDEGSDLMLESKDDFGSLERHLGLHACYLPDSIPGLWSGCRSALVRDPNSRKMYRLKGVAVDPYSPRLFPKERRINGGHKLYNARCEIEMSSQFNTILEGVGIEPVMVPKGMWRYPVPCRGLRPVASLFEVRGDTRLDELVIALENLLYQKVKWGRKGEDGSIVYDWTFHGSSLTEDIALLMLDIGLMTGRLKRLMDRSGMIWGHSEDCTNAHWGNVVLYRDRNKLKVNLVDLDIAEDRRVHSLQKIRVLQKEEYDAVLGNMVDGESVSPRDIRGRPFVIENGLLFGAFRNFLKAGFEKGYSSTRRKYTNETDIGRLLDIFYMLRIDVDFTINPNEDEEARGNRLMDYWVERPAEFMVYADRLNASKRITGEQARDMKLSIQLEHMRRKGLDTESLEERIDKNPELADKFLRRVKEGAELSKQHLILMAAQCA